MSQPAFVDAISIDALENDPYPIYRRLRAEAPVAWIPAAEVWFVTRFDDCATVGRGDGGFIGAKDHPTLDRVFGAPNVLTSEGEIHEQIRTGVDPRLKPRSVNDIVDELVRPVCRRRLAAMADRGYGDLMEDYFEPVSVEALRRVMGLDAVVDADTLRRWFHGLNGAIANLAMDPERFAEADAISREIEETLAPLLAELEQGPDDSMIGHMLWTGVTDGRPRPVRMIMPTLKVILLGGMQEPGHGAGSTLHGLFGRPEQLALAVADPATWAPMAVNEGLRWLAPIGVVERQATQDVVVAGVTIPAGAVVECVIASANRDETKFDDPDTFDMERSTRSHQAFGAGHHFCAGHFFARNVERIMFEELLPALPGLRPDPDAEPDVRGWFFRAPQTLPARWDAVIPRDEPIVTVRTAPPGTLALQVSDIRPLAEDVLMVELRDPSGKALPAWEPGAHIDFWVQRDRAAQYSLCGDPAVPEVWQVAVLKEPESRGTSRWIHDQMRKGDTVDIGPPRNHFHFQPAERIRFIAGGIGITALLPMLAAATKDGADWVLDYCGRTPDTMAFIEDLEAYGERVRIHCGGDRLDIPSLVRSLDPATVVYCCGPERMLAEVERETPAAGLVLHVEHFAGVEALRADDVPFDVVIASTGRTLRVDADQTILDVLTRSGFVLHSACHEGNCGSCETAVLAGGVEHRDLILTPEQRLAGNRMMVCVSRAAGERIVLDL